MKFEDRAYGTSKGWATKRHGGDKAGATGMPGYAMVVAELLLDASAQKNDTASP